MIEFFFYKLLTQPIIRQCSLSFNFVIRPQILNANFIFMRIHIDTFLIVNLLIFDNMDRKIGIAMTVLAVLAIALFSNGVEQKRETHNLITVEKAEAFVLFENWIQKNSKKYREDEEKSYRFGKFFQNYLFVREHNKRFKAGLETFEVELNKFADLDRFEFKHLYTGLKRRDPKKAVTSKCTGQVKILDNLPPSFDWAGRAVTPVKNQGMCGSCWAFSACGALEGLAGLTKGVLYNFSPQQMVDCSTKQDYGNEGCDGGEMNAAMWYVIDHGITTLDKYPYAGKNQKCAYKDTMKVFQNTRCAQVPANKTKALASAVVKQPVSISVEADTLQFQFYKKGVFTGKCGTDLDHGIVLTGYGSLDGKDYWKCKNSWGSDWGMEGYILIVKTDEDGPGHCGILMENTVPLE